MARLSAYNSTAPIKTPVNDGDFLKHSHTRDSSDMSPTSSDPTSDSYPVKADPTLIPGGSRDLSSIGLQAYLLGVTSSAGAFLTVLFIYLESAWWRLPAFFVFLGIFHFLEYWTTAAYNVPAVRASSFILFSNGKAYTTAHTLATVEIIVSNFFPAYQRWGVWWITIAVGLGLVVVGQVVRSYAMKQAGTNFNHLVQTKHNEGHVLVTQGLYGYMRHPSYFGFFWWAIGTQVLVGNKVCLVGYAIVLWRFFHHRIRIEETHLVSFFGEKYKDFRKTTGTKIPFIR